MMVLRKDVNCSLLENIFVKPYKTYKTFDMSENFKTQISKKYNKKSLVVFLPLGLIECLSLIAYIKLIENKLKSDILYIVSMFDAPWILLFPKPNNSKQNSNSKQHQIHYKECFPLSNGHDPKPEPKKNKTAISRCDAAPKRN